MEHAGNANPDCPVLGTCAPVNDIALTQLKTTAHCLAGIVHAAGQPYLCPGNKYPVGAVFASRGWVHPPLIGSDIGCGMAWYKTRLSRSQVDGDKGQKIAEKLRGLAGPWRTKPYRDLWLQDEAGSYAAGEEWIEPLARLARALCRDPSSGAPRKTILGFTQSTSCYLFVLGQGVTAGIS